MDNLTTQLCITSAIREIEKHCKTSPNIVSLKHVAESIQEQEKYAELGRAAEKARNNQCPFMGKYDFMSKTCKRCIIRDYCQKRAELLGE